MVNVKCDLCGADDYEVIYTRGRGEAVQNVACNRCGLVYVNPREIIDYETEFRPEPPSEKKIAEMKQSAKRRADRINRHLKPGKVYEIGCGAGYLLKELKNTGWEVAGCEPDKIYAGMASGLNVRQGYFEAEGHYDLVIMSHVIEHLESPREMLLQIRQILDIEGSLYVECPTIDRPYDGDLELFFWKAHLYSFSAQTLFAMLHTTGYSSVTFDIDHWFMWAIARGLSYDMPVESIDMIKAKLRG